MVHTTTGPPVVGGFFRNVLQLHTVQLCIVESYPAAGKAHSDPFLVGPRKECVSRLSSSWQAMLAETSHYGFIRGRRK